MTMTQTTTVSDAQRDMRLAYYDGAPGMLTSASVWLVAGIVAARVSPNDAIWALFVGGALIHPVSVQLARLLGRSGKHTPGNPFAPLAMATTFWMILSLPLAYCVALIHIEWFFPAMLFIIGGRYLTFQTLFGTRIFWACGAALALAGYALGSSYAAPMFGAFAGAIIEGGFAIAIFATARRAAAA